MSTSIQEDIADIQVRLGRIEELLLSFSPKPQCAKSLVKDSTVTSGKACPRCGGPMKLKTSRVGNKFYGCMKFPKCNGSAPEKESLCNSIGPSLDPNELAAPF